MPGGTGPPTSPAAAPPSLPSRRQALGALVGIGLAGAAGAGAVAAARFLGRIDGPTALPGLPLPGTVAGTDRLAASRDGGALCAAVGQQLLVIDPAGGARIVRAIDLPAAADRIALSPDGVHCFATSLAGLSAVDVATGAVRSTVGVRGGIEGVAVAPDGGRLYCPSLVSGGLLAVDPATLAATVVPVAGYAGGGVALSADGRQAWVAVLDGVAAVDVTTGARSATLQIGTPSGLVGSPDGRYVYVRAPSTVAVVDTAGGLFRLRFSVPEGALVDPFAGPDGSPALLVQSGRELTVVDARNGVVTGSAVLPTGDAAVTALRRLPDGRVCVAVEDHGDVAPRAALLVLA